MEDRCPLSLENAIDATSSAVKFLGEGGPTILREPHILLVMLAASFHRVTQRRSLSSTGTRMQELAAVG
jgi:hypothetical protein